MVAHGHRGRQVNYSDTQWSVLRKTQADTVQLREFLWIEQVPPVTPGAAKASEFPQRVSSTLSRIVEERLAEHYEDNSWIVHVSQPSLRAPTWPAMFALI